MADNVRKFGEHQIRKLKEKYPTGEGLSIYIEDTKTIFIDNATGEILATGNGVYDLIALWDMLFPEAHSDFSVEGNYGEIKDDE